MIFYEKEMDNFVVLYKMLSEINNKVLTMKWDNGAEANVIYDTCFEDSEEDEEIEEEFNSFVFKVLSKTENAPIVVPKDLCIINYKNFPNKIFIGNKKIYSR